MKLIYEINKYGRWQETCSQIVYYTLDTLQADIHRNYNIREMLVLEKDGENRPTKIEFDVKEK